MDEWMDRQNDAVAVTVRMNDDSCLVQIEVKEARDMMVEANTQEYAFNFLQQSLKNKLQDADVRTQNYSSSVGAFR